MKNSINRQKFEWNKLLQEETETRKQLRILHILNRSNRIKNKQDFIYVASAIQQETLDVLELHCIFEEKRAIMSDRHAMELIAIEQGDLWSYL